MLRVFLCVSLTAPYVGNHIVEDGRNDQGGDAEGQKGCSGLRNRDIEELLDSVEATGEEGHAQDEQQIGKHAANERGFDDGDFVFDQGLNRDDKLDGVTGIVSDGSQSQQTWRMHVPK